MENGKNSSDNQHNTMSAFDAARQNRADTTTGQKLDLGPITKFGKAVTDLKRLVTGRVLDQALSNTQREVLLTEVTTL